MRKHLAALGALSIFAVTCVGQVQPADAQMLRANRIMIENAHAGTDKWQLPWTGFTVSDDINLQIKGYAGRESAEPGETVPLKVTVTPAQAFTVDVIRLGDYHGLGGRFMEHLGPIAGVHQRACGMVRSTRMNVCDWNTSVALHIPQNWISGVYVAVLSNAAKFQSLIPFWVVEQKRSSDMLFISSLNTYEAYNDFPFDPLPSDPNQLPQTGHSLYDFSSAGSIPAVKVTFDRPFSSQYGNPGDGGVYDFEPELIGFLEKSGYDVTYAPDPVIDADPGSLQLHNVVVIGGHAEYQTLNSYNAFYAVRDNGVGLAFISGNEIYWQVRYEPNFAGVPRRIVVGYKHFALDPVRDPRLRTINWRELGRPEQKLIGVQLPDQGWMSWGGQPWVPQHTDHWAFAGTGLRAGVPVNAEVAGYEIDNFDPRVGLPDGIGYTLLSASPFLTSFNVTKIQNSSIYLSQAQNWVWATGSMDWSWALYPGGSSAGGNNVRPALQVMTHNILNRMIHDAQEHGQHGAGP
ncbi:MAG: hypothetical protein M3Z37_02500 [Candidatus Eremiobacteraeota bacterium]|nr:hypothetical protein [Candidatus Eremiobacteraeota bacterium]